MRPFFSIVLLVGITAFLLQWIFPWWIVVVIGLAAGYFGRLDPWQSFAAVLFAIGLVWLVMAVWLTLNGSGVLLPRLTILFRLPADWLVFVATVAVGSLPPAFAALGGAYLRT